MIKLKRRFFIAALVALLIASCIFVGFNSSKTAKAESVAFPENVIKDVYRLNDELILPATVTDLGGGVFRSCDNLTFVSMVGIKSLIYDVDGRPDGSKSCNNNFLRCYKLTTVIIASDFYTNTQQFTDGSQTVTRIDNPFLNFYVNG